jgi:mannose-6-phosphate isomerase-like protein (cupin superfamily)
MNKLFTPKNHHEFLGKQNYPTLDWIEIINNIDKNISKNQKVDILEGLTLITIDIYENQKVISILDDISIENPKSICTAHLYVSLSKKSSTFGKHKDDADVWYWQCQGITRWTVYDNQEYIYDLKEGDMIFVPRKMYHSTKPLSPRAGISFGIS